jgi:autotransporter-associated beta strand protein
MIRIAMIAFAALLLPCTGLAQTWTGASSNNWRNSGNWSPAGVPVGGPDTQLSFGATANATMTDDIPGLFTLNQMTFGADSPVYSLGGIGLNFQTSSTGNGPQIVDNSTNRVSLGLQLTLTNSLMIGGAGALTISDPVNGPGGLTLAGGGSLALSNSSNTYSGGTNIVNGIVSAFSDSSLGTGNVTGTASGILAFTGTTATGKSFAMNGGSITIATGLLVTFNGSNVSGAYLDGAGTFNTYITTGNRFVNVTASPSVSVTSNNANDQFVHFTNSGKFTVAAGVNSNGASTTLNWNGFVNEGAGSLTIGAASKINVSNFQSYGVLTLNPAAAGQQTLLKNVGTAPLGFDGGSRTFIATPATAGQQLAGIDLNGKNALVMGGLFINNGFVIDSSNNGTGTGAVIAHYGSLVGGGGYFQNPVQTVPGGRFEAGIGTASFGTLVLGPGGVSSYVFALDDAQGTPGGSPAGIGRAGGWGLMAAVRGTVGGITMPGDFTWTATPAGTMSVALDTIFGPSTSDVDSPAAMANFDPAQSYVWPAVRWDGTYSGPTDAAALNAATAFDPSGIVNPIAGTFGWSLDLPGHTLSIVYTPSAVPEPGTLGLTALAGLAFVRRLRRRHLVLTIHGS